MRITQVTMGTAFACAFLLVGFSPSADAQDHKDQDHNHEQAPAPHNAMQGAMHHDATPNRQAHAPVRGEEHRGPTGYSRVTEPKGWNTRPATVDRGAYQHNFRAARSFHVGPYHRPAGWSAHTWGYGQTLPRAYWTSQYILADYWLFALEVPPAGYEWVRDGADALLINTDSGEILQVEYSVFA